MYRNKISAEESLEAIKLRMKYDSKKTLNENKTILVEQNAKTDAGIIHKELHDAFTDEKKIVATIVNKYKNWLEFKGLLDSYESQFKVKMGDDFGRGFTPQSDKKEWTELKDYLNGVGVDMIEFFDNKTKKYGASFFSFANPTGGSDDLKNYPPCIQSLKIDPTPDRDGNYGVTDTNRNDYFLNCRVYLSDGKMNNYSCKGNTIEIGKVGNPKAGCKVKSSGGGGGNKAKIQIPDEFKTKEGIQHFQDWLDEHRPGWAWGYTEGKIAKGKNGGGYGTFGPRTSAAWSKHKKAYLSGEPVDNKNTKVDDTGVDVSIEPVNIVEK